MLDLFSIFDKNVFNCSMLSYGKFPTFKVNWLFGIYSSMCANKKDSWPQKEAQKLSYFCFLGSNLNISLFSWGSSVWFYHIVLHIIRKQTKNSLSFHVKVDYFETTI
jgi:hypothetical protein